MTEHNKPFGRLRKIPVRDLWASEASDFTPWLATDQNISLLAEAIGIELEVEAQEKDVGPFRADILCRDTRTGQWVLIENQLERTDHTHLGQLITYAAGLKAVTIVWIAARFTEEHRAALDWLNQTTADEFLFFGLEVEAWCIGDSPPAPKFNTICKPNDWSRQVAGGAERIKLEALTGSKKLQLEFWTAFKTYADEHARRFRPTKPLPQNWLTFAVGRSGFNLSAVASTYDSAAQTWDAHELRAELVINHTESKQFYELLLVQRIEIESELGEPLEWYSVEDVRMCRVYIRRSADLDKRHEWPEYHKWLTEVLDRLHEVLQPRIKALDLEASIRQLD